jgi:predicted 2-oxoglutarate/Fe(II)-dependent dioxygenase YbiX
MLKIYNQYQTHGVKDYYQQFSNKYFNPHQDRIKTIYIKYIKDVNISLTKYYSGKWLDLHIDANSQFTTVIMLSDEFDDGRFTLSNSYMNINNAQKYHLNIGECISFDGSKIYHGVMPVTNGIRCALNIWMTNTDYKYRPLKTNKTLI